MGGGRGPINSLEKTYQIYGLRIGSHLPLPALPGSERLPDREVFPDLVLHYRGVLPSRDLSGVTAPWFPVRHGWRMLHRAASGEMLEFRFNASGTHIHARASASDFIGDLGAMFVGSALGAVLHLRDVPVIHASAIALEGEAILVAGHAGAGKSTLTASLVTLGYPLLSEDLCAIWSNQAGELAVQSGYPRLRLCPDSTVVIGQEADRLPHVFDPRLSDDKRWVDARTLAGGFHTAPLPLGTIYLLQPRRFAQGSPQIVVLPPHRGALALLDHLYGALWLHVSPEEALKRCSRIASHTSVRLVYAPEGVHRIPETAEALAADARQSHTHRLTKVS